MNLGKITHDPPPKKPATPRYRLQDKLGEGGMGIIHRATDRLTDSAVASEAF